MPALCQHLAQCMDLFFLLLLLFFTNLVLIWKEGTAQSGDDLGMNSCNSARHSSSVFAFRLLLMAPEIFMCSPMI